MLESEKSGPSLRHCLIQLKQLVEEPSTGRETQWYENMSDQLEQLELALGDGGSKPSRSESVKEITRTHPRLISLCGEFQRDGRRLLRHSALVVRLSLRSYDADKAPFIDLHAATVSLIDAVEEYLAMEAELTGEASQDLGGEG